jgi:hypothetical protein
MRNWGRQTLLPGKMKPLTPSPHWRAFQCPFFALNSIFKITWAGSTLWPTSVVAWQDEAPHADTTLAGFSVSIFCIEFDLARLLPGKMKLMKPLTPTPH